MRYSIISLIIAANLTSVHADQGQGNPSSLVEEAKTKGSCIEVTHCRGSDQNFPTAWLLNGKVVQEKHVCGQDCKEKK
ncbi:MAG: hypothetical protein K2Y18_00850 [Alphaproteobacteria bacterium]|jgi:hypothetical protein|nr:hypothetical protein [Alphaproteobacteria bacterium]